MDKKQLQKKVDELWPKTKKEWEATLEKTKKLIAQGEEHLKTFSEQSVRKTRQISLSLKREKLYYELGKLVAHTAPVKWKMTKKISAFLAEIRLLGREIKRHSK
jgi:hypothetical protein